MNIKEIWIDENTLFYKQFDRIETVNLSLLKYAYVQILGNVPFLYIFTDMQHYISTELLGFDLVYRELSNIYKFDDNTFFQVSKANVEDSKAKIWAKNIGRNYTLMDDYLADGNLGYEVYSEPKQMISWDTTYEQLEKLGLVQTYVTDYGVQYLRFIYKVRIEGIVIDQLELYAENVIANRPVQEFFVDLYDETNTDASYKELRAFWLDEDIDVEKYGWERPDQCYLKFIFADDIYASICYTYDDESGDDNGSTTLHFYNNRSYDYFLENSDYEESIEITQIILFKKKIDINVNYIDHEGVKFIPQKVKDLMRGNSGIWLDSLNKKIGFVGIEHALILDIGQIKSFSFQNTLQARGPGYSDFIVHFKSGDYLTVFNDDTFYFDQFSEQVKKMTHKNVQIPEAYPNC